MDYIPDTPQHPAQAVGYPAEGRGTDGDGGATVGSPSAGERAVGEDISQQCENPLLCASTRSAWSANRDPDERLNAYPAPRQDPHLPLGNGGMVSMPVAGPPHYTNLAPTAQSRAACSKVKVKLRPRVFKIGAWNMQGRICTRDGKRTNKMQYAEELVLLERLDLLVLSETHSMTLTHSRRVVTLCQTGLSDCSAGVAILAHSLGSWECTESHTLIDGYALMAHLRHRKSTESFWIMAVYGDISGSTGSILSFYKTLTLRLNKFIAKQKNWDGCFAAGDWNFVTRREDRTGSSAAYAPKALLKLHDDITYMCKMKDVLGIDAPPGQWTHVQKTESSTSKSRLDRIYCPNENWFPESPATIPTPWSDHFLLTVTCTINRPKVQIAVAAPRLPSVDRLDNIFWKQTLSEYATMTSQPVSLESWTKFKKAVLAIGISSRSRISTNKEKNWLSALRKCKLNEGDLDSALRWLHHKPHPRPKWYWHKQWPSAVPELVHAPSKAVPKWLPSVESPWYSTTLIQPRLVHPARPEPVRDAPPPVRASIIETALLKRMRARRLAARKKAMEMERLHTSEWYQQCGDNKDADERGSRASISVEGLRLTTNHRASRQLGEMVQIARSYFWKLHTPESNPPSRRALQDTLLGEVSREYGPLPPPKEVTSGPFTLAETHALRRHMNNSAPGPDGIQYGFWKALVAKIKDNNAKARLGIKGHLPLRQFWASFTDMANDVKSRGSSRHGFKSANISMFYKKGDPTLPQNYRPISSMNTDCKLYTTVVHHSMRMADKPSSRIDLAAPHIHLMYLGDNI